MSELRRHPFLETWVITATHRQDRTFFPPPDYNPLAPTAPGGFETEIPLPAYDLAVFQNKFPSLAPIAADPAVAGDAVSPVRPSQGVCEVVCYSSDPHASFATMPFAQVRKLGRVWRDRYRTLAARPEVEYVYIFENKGREIGVTLSHPHGQIYAYPFIPPTAETEIRAERAHWEESGAGLMGDVIEQAERRELTVCENDHAVAFVPFFARYPYEVYVAPKAHRPHLDALSVEELDGFLAILHEVTRRYDALFGFSMPYVMAMHQSPTRVEHPGAWLHVEFYPPYRTAEKLKYLAGSEAGMNAFINDTLPEVTSKTLRDLPIAPSM